ncbi:MAG: metal-dependent hydrolase [Candidatus Thorarchaeota archaeon]|nr:MAG: metal-dependent hydrolase [Candidatus Thorarchaeota archaeon]
MKVTYLGHASFKVESDGKTVYVDPWLNGPTSPIKVSDVDKADIVLVTHDHGDHGYQEAIEICKKTGAYFIAINELGIQAKSEGLENVHTLNIGGSVNVGGVDVTLVQAFHSCGTGAPTGFIVKFPSDSFYHPGDTGLFATMELFGELYDIDVFFAPIGSYYVMDIHQAAFATKLIKPKVVIPMHYDTFPAIKADPKEFEKLVAEKSPGTKVKVLAPGESTNI